MGTLRPGRMSAPGMTKPTEAIARARAGDAEAWGQLYRDYAPAIFRFCRRALPTREDAEDATMEIFMKLKDKLVQYDATRSFSAWLYKVAANHCWDTLRRRRIRQDKETDDLENVPLEHPDPSQLDQLIEQRTSEEVRRALNKLGGGSRTRAGSFRAHTRVRCVPHTAAGAGERIAAADTSDAGRRRTATLAAGAISGTRPEIHAVDLGSDFRPGGNGSLRALYDLYPA